MPPYEVMHAFVDESDHLETGGPLVIAVWLTGHWDSLWVPAIVKQRRAEHYWYELHYHKIGKSSTDRRARLSLRLADKLLEISRSWYARVIHVSNSYKDLWKDKWSQEDVHQVFLSELSRQFLGHARTQNLQVYVDAKRTNGFDVHLLRKLSQQLNDPSGPRIEMRAEDSSRNDGLQMADLIAGGVARYLAPGDNPNKQAIAEIMGALIDMGRIGVWHWSG